MHAATLAFLAQHRESRVDPLTDHLVEVIVTQNVGYRSVQVPLSDLRASCRDNIERVLELLASELGPEPDDVEDQRFDAAFETGRRRATQGLPLDDVLRSFRLGGRLIWDDLVAAADELPDGLDGESLREVGTGLWEVVDRTSSRVAAAYHEAERELVRADEQRSAAIWEELLAGRARDPAFARLAAQSLGIPGHGPYLAATLSSASGDIVARLERAGVVSSWHRRTDTVVGVLALDHTAPARALEALATPGVARGGLSGIAPSLADLATSFAESALALRTVRPGDAQVVRFDDRLVEALLLSAPDLAGRLVGVWLQPVLDLAAGERGVLLGTLRAWVDSGGSMTRTAVLANCHRNTAMNRIARVGDLIGVQLGEGAVPVELTLALRAADLNI